jgi:hypothetical protein
MLACWSLPQKISAERAVPAQPTHTAPGLQKSSQWAAGRLLTNRFGVHSDEQRETHCDDDDTARLVTRAAVMRIVDRAEKVLLKEALALYRRTASA